MLRYSAPVLFLLLVLSCSEQTAQNVFRAGRPGHPGSALTPAQRAISPITTEWLVGYWGYNGRCRPPYLDTALWPDGTYTMGDGSGRWALSGKTLTVRGERRPSIEFMYRRLGDPGVSTLRKTGPNEVQVRATDGPDVLYRRCD